MNAEIKKSRSLRGRLSNRLAAVLVAAILPVDPVRASPPAGRLPDAEARGVDAAHRTFGPLPPAVEAWLRIGLDWYGRTPATDRMCRGGLAACAGLGLMVLAERLLRLRRRRIIPPDFTARFLDRLNEGKLDGGKALDYCEMNPSPAARVALAAVRRWGRPSVDLERAVALAHRVEAERLRRNVGTLRRIATVAPLVGLLGTLTSAGRLLDSLPASPGTSWGPSAAQSLSFLTLGTLVATLALVAYDALSVRIERLCGVLDRLGAETIDAIAMAAPARPPALPAGSVASGSHGVHAGHQGVPRPALADELPAARHASEMGARS